MIWEYMRLEYKNKYKDEFKRCIKELKHKDTFFKQIPNLLTFFRAISMIPVNILFLLGKPILGIILASLALSTDFFDGKIARKYNIQSDFGADLDAVCDKIVFLGLSLPLVLTNIGIFINLFFEGLIAYVNIKGRMNGKDTSTIFAGKVKTWILSITLIAGYLTSILGLPIEIFTSLIAVSALSQSCVLVKYRNISQKSVRENNNIDITLEESKEEIEQHENNLIQDLKKERDFLLDSKICEDNKHKKRIRQINKEQ